MGEARRSASRASLGLLHRDLRLRSPRSPAAARGRALRRRRRRPPRLADQAASSPTRDSRPLRNRSGGSARGVSATAREPPARSSTPRPSFNPAATCWPPELDFVGPSMPEQAPIDAELEAEIAGRPLIYVSLGTVFNERPRFFRDCLGVLRRARRGRAALDRRSLRPGGARQSCRRMRSCDARCPSLPCSSEPACSSPTRA